MRHLQAAGIVQFNRHAACASVAIGVPREERFRMVEDYRTANVQVELVP